jgi:hypothetical protein
MNFRSTLLSFAFATVATVALADPSGKYAVEGKGPDGSTYKGSATITKTGDTYKVVWVIGSDKFIGTAVGDDDFFAVGYKSGNDSGIAVYGREGKASWKGVWTYSGGTKIGSELLTPQ